MFFLRIGKIFISLLPLSLTENNPITYFSILQITKQIRQVYMGDTEIILKI